MEHHARPRPSAPTIVLHLLLAAATAGVTLLGTLVAAEPATRSAAVAGPVLAGVLAATVVAAIRRPRLSLAVAAAAVVGYHLADFPAIGSAWPLAVNLYLVAAAGSAVPTGAVMAILIASSALWRAQVEQHALLTVTDGVARETGLAAIAILLGEVVHRRAAWRHELARRFSDRQQQLEHELQHQAARQRLAVAREVHDTVAHTLAVVGVQADVAAETLRHGHPERSAEALDVVRRTNRHALDELRRTVSLLRQDTADGEQRRPVPRVADLPDLVAQVAGSGLRVELRGATDLTLPFPVDATAYRVVQEALTNIIKHARATSAHVDVRLYGDRLDVQVTDDGSAGPAADGNGLRGMRERAAAIGGRLTAGPCADGGFRVHLSAPLRGGS